MGIPVDVDDLLADDAYKVIAPATAYSGLSAAGAIGISVRLAGVSDPVDLTVEGSADEAAWSEIGSLSALTESDSIVIDAPPNFVRASVDGEATSIELRLRPFRSGGSGGSPPFHGAMVWLDSSQLVNPGNSISWDAAVYDSDAYFDGSDIVIPPGLGGIYLMEAAIYLSPESDGNPDLDRPFVLLAEPSDSCDIQVDRKHPDSNDAFPPGWWYGSGGFVRPLEESFVLEAQVNGSTSNTGSKIEVKGGGSVTMMSITRLGPLPDGYSSPF
jgi:hypothetical protein